MDVENKLMITTGKVGKERDKAGDWDWHIHTAAAAKSLQSCLTLCNPIDGSQPGSTIPGILQARILEWVAISFSNALKWKVKVKSLSRVRLLATPWTAAYWAPPSMGFSRQEYWSEVPLPSPTSMWDECNCAVVWAFFGIAFLWDRNENWPFPCSVILPK